MEDLLGIAAGWWAYVIRWQVLLQITAIVGPPLGLLILRKARPHARWQRLSFARTLPSHSLAARVSPGCRGHPRWGRRVGRGRAWLLKRRGFLRARQLPFSYSWRRAPSRMKTIKMK